MQVLVSYELLGIRIGSGKYGVSKWIQFCKFMLDKGYRVTLYEARETVSKYVTVHGINDDTFKVRFSNHRPIYHRELAGDFDFFCGVTHTGVRTVEDAIEACLSHFGKVNREYIHQVVKEEQNKMEEESARRTAGSLDHALGWTSIHLGTQTPWVGGIEPATSHRNKRA